ncbi:MAG TPA: helix-turn-helix domain-containing protein [Thermomicrobiales bacterium]|nr:helix-turn-helix domain-containing protein [Thermomicrobiales bacterium]
MNAVRAQEVLTPDQAADYLHVNRATIYRYIRDGRLLASRLGRSYRIPRRNLDLSLDANRTRRDITLREFSAREIADFLSADCLDGEVADIAARIERWANRPAATGRGLTEEPPSFLMHRV